MRVWRDGGLSEAERLEAIYRGDLVLSPCHQAVERLAAWLWRELEARFPEGPPRDAHRLVSQATLLARLRELRELIASEGALRPLVGDVLAAYGCDPDHTWYDVPRLHAVPSNGHNRRTLAHHHVAHRDTWFANPEAQLTWWIPIRPARGEEAFVFYPEYWQRPIKNTSHRFDYARWAAHTSPWSPCPFSDCPAPEEPIEGVRLRVGASEGEVLQYSGTHLHEVLGHSDDYTRFGIELRSVLDHDLARLRRERRLDAAATGSSLSHWLRARDATRFPPDRLAALLVA